MSLAIYAFRRERSTDRRDCWSLFGGCGDLPELIDGDGPTDERLRYFGREPLGAAQHVRVKQDGARAGTGSNVHGHGNLAV
jgi:hypothetical protein